MKVCMDVTCYKDILRKDLLKRSRDEVYLLEFPGGPITCGEILDALDKESPLAQELVGLLAESSLRLYVLRNIKN